MPWQLCNPPSFQKLLYKSANVTQHYIACVQRDVEVATPTPCLYATGVQHASAIAGHDVHYLLGPNSKHAMSQAGSRSIL